MKTLLTIASILLWIAALMGDIHPAVSAVFMVVNFIFSW